MQHTGLDLETKGFNQYVDGINEYAEVRGDETITGANGDPIMENDPLSELLPILSRSYSFGSSGNGILTKFTSSTYTIMVYMKHW